jgi:hypothetical protein
LKADNGNAAARLETFAVGVRMRVEKPRQHAAALKIDAPRRGRGRLEQRRILAHGRDERRAHRDRLRHA